MAEIFAPLHTEPHPLLQKIEVASFFQLPGFQIIGLPNPEVTEAKERIRAAIESSGIEFPKRKIIVNLSPASVRKRGTGIDLAMALAILGQNIRDERKFAAWGELGLDGAVKPAGQLTRALYACWEKGVSDLICAREELAEAQEAVSRLKDAELFKTEYCPKIHPASTLEEAWAVLQPDAIPSGEAIAPPPGIPHSITAADSSKSHQAAEEEERVKTSSLHLLPLHPTLEKLVGISSAGHHHLLLLGSRGSGKSHALEWLIALQPKTDPKDALEHCLLQELSAQRVGFQPGVRRVSSQVRPAALIGGANSACIRPGEFSMAHGGILIADELPEWFRDSREALREPLERGKITLTRTQGALELPARFLFAANGNFCPCGGWPNQLPVPSEWQAEKQKLPRCKCPPQAAHRYLQKLSGPLLDRLDLIALVPPPVKREYSTSLHPSVERKDPLKHLLKRVKATRERLEGNWGALPGLLPASKVESIIQDLSQQNLLPYQQTLPNSLRTRHKVARLALSFAAWREAKQPGPSDWAEANLYRPEQFFNEAILS